MLTPQDARRIRACALQIIAQEQSRYLDTLETYLRSLWTALQQHVHEAPTPSLICGLFAEAFDVPPAPWDPAWWTITRKVRPLDEQRHLFSANQIASDDWDYLRSTILYQIADLRRIVERGLDDPDRYVFGVRSPTDWIWYNFDPFTYLERGTALFAQMDDDYYGPDEEQGISGMCAWTDLAHILIDGSTYE